MFSSTPKDHTPLKIGAVPKYLKERYQLDVSRQTVYNWMKTGRKQETLKYAHVKNPEGSHIAFTVFTTVEWLEDFFARSGVRDG